MSERRSRASRQDETPAPVIVRRSKKGGDHAAHHGGAWKIAYADFVTAMMAFFLLMWLLGSTSKYDKQGIEDYFNTPLSSLFGGNEGTAAARPSVIQGGGRDISDTRPADGKKTQTEPTPPAKVPPIVVPADAARLQQLKEKLTALIEQSPALKAFKDQIRISITNEGLRIEIVDSQNRPMFPSGSSKLQPYAVTILTQIGAALNDVENRISIAGHTDAVPYTAGPEGYSNWELSSERANAARRALVAGSMHGEKLLQVRGLADVLPLNSNVADEPTNRRISILVLNKAAELAFFHDGGRTAIDETSPASSTIPEVVNRLQPVSVSRSTP
ncbi:flagellar motor protein MotB [Paraburkholderia nemoris]|uniref:Motility protein B n=1 Tax=Paraburkholderia nemoris TaxID=2793076 RepID=A0ABN7L629_9BURK|nr:MULTISPECIES: flagellar motor protein MotB [Paraburkholderia]MBK3810491.1 flagellar motor protein MotB [Paraburkholderia aspalathi]CAE6696400.1 Motility protein B [Paraburkholderia nemoris]CAE6732759.1 Motility protein B [Paraburkholderia nemoris]